MGRFLWCSLVAVFLVVPLAAEEAPLLYVRAGRLLDVRSGQVLTDQMIVVRGERIERVGPATEIRVPAEARLVNLGRAMVLPGLIDVHGHLTSDHRFHGYRGLAVSVPRQALHGALNARKTCGRVLPLRGT